MGRERERQYDEQPFVDDGDEGDDDNDDDECSCDGDGQQQEYEDIKAWLFLTWDLSHRLQIDDYKAFDFE
eukprot:4012498-Karenia_brevis.AAC.1